jgi:hypothetical protein
MTATKPRRGRREWFVDTGLFLFAALFGLMLAIDRLDSPPLPVPVWLFGLDQIVGVLAVAEHLLRCFPRSVTDTEASDRRSRT